MYVGFWLGKAVTSVILSCKVSGCLVLFVQYLSQQKGETLQ